MSNADGFFISLDGLKELCTLAEEKAEEAQVSPVDFTVGFALCRFMDKEGKCWPSREALSKRTGIHRFKTISGAISKLVDVGFIERVRTQRGYLYRLRRGEKCYSGNSGGAESALPESGQENPGGAGAAMSGGAEGAPPIHMNESMSSVPQRGTGSDSNFATPKKEGDGYKIPPSPSEPPTEGHT